MLKKKPKQKNEPQPSTSQQNTPLPNTTEEVTEQNHFVKVDHFRVFWMDPVRNITSK